MVLNDSSWECPFSILLDRNILVSILQIPYGLVESSKEEKIQRGTFLQTPNLFWKYMFAVCSHGQKQKSIWISFI